jgi:hypothetical protein
MLRYILLSTSELRKQITASPVICETSKRGAGFPYAIQFVDDNAAVVELDAGGGEVVTIGFKAPAGYDSVAFTVGPFTAVKSGTGTSTVYTFTLSFLTALLDQLLATNLDDVELVPEIKWESTLYNGETLAFGWTVQNNVNRGGENVVAYPVTDTVLDLTQVTRLVGGVYPTDLDAQLLAGFPNGKKFSVVVDISGDGVLGEKRYQKRAGTELVSVSPDFILCRDGTRLYIMAG